MMRLSSNLRRFRWLVFGAWLLAVIPAVWLTLTSSGNLTGGGFEVAGSQSLHLQYQLEDHFPDESASPLALVAAPRPDATYADMTAAVALLHRVAGEVPSVKVVPDSRQPAPQPDRPYVVTLRLDFNNTGAVDVAKQLRAKVGTVGDRPGTTAEGRVRLYVIGQGALGAAASETTKHDIAQAEHWNLPIVLIVLLAVFGSLAAAAIPLFLGACTVIVTMGLVYLLSTVMQMSVFATTTLSMFGIALAIDYSLFILMRFREELRAGRDPAQATDAAMATSGLAVVLSGLTVIASVSAIYIIGTPVLSSMATGAILAVAMAVLTSTTVIPAVLATFGRAAARRSPMLRWSRRGEVTQSRFWTRWVRAVMRRPWMSALAAAVFLLVLAAPAFSMLLGNSMLRQFPSSHEIRTGVAAAAEALGPGALGPVRVLVTFPDGDATTPERTAVTDAVAREMASAVNVVSVSPPTLSNDKRSVLFSAILAVDPEDMAARNTIDWMRQQLPRVAATGPSAATVSVGGPTALIKDFDDRVSHTQPLVFAAVAVIAFVMLLISIRSVFLAFKGVVMTILSVAAAYGSLVMIFQWGWLQGLGFHPISSIDSTIPPLVLAMTFGLSMDYEIFLLTRIRERFLQSGDTRDAVAYGVATSARTITSAALIMIAVFIGFAFAGMPLVAELGVACAVAIAVDATVVRLVLVPALMAMFEQWNWWLPRWLDRILPSVDFEKPLPEVDLGDLVIIPDDISELVMPNADLRTVVKSGALLRELAPDAVTVADPLVFRGCAGDVARRTSGNNTGALAVADGRTATLRRVGSPAAPQVHPVTMWRARQAIAVDALQAAADHPDPALRRSAPIEMTNVALPTGDRLQIPTGAETVRLKGYLLVARNSRRDYNEFSRLVQAIGPQTVALVLLDIDGYYCGQPSSARWVTTQLVRQLADPLPGDHASEASSADADADWEEVRRRCLSVAVAMLEETR
ncbi:MAG TPA: MMPL family transporter [Mycobacterium sp.]|nr:MMPL family transporter [Mycobacterium sp.]